MQATTKGEHMNKRPAVGIHAATSPDMDWVLTEPVDVTLVKLDSGETGTPECETLVLVTRTVRPGAITLSFRTDGQVLVNGVYQDLGEDLMEYCSMTDELVMGPSPVIGSTVRSYPDPDSE